MNVLYTTNIPSPYRVDFFNELGKLCNLTVLFETRSARSRNPKWIADKFTNFNAVFMRGVRFGDAEAFCPEICKHLDQNTYNIIVVEFYASPTGMWAIQYMRSKKIPFFISSDGGFKKSDARIKHLIKEYFISSASAWLSTGKITSEYLEHYGAKKNKIYIYPFTSIKAGDILRKPLTIQEKQIYRKKLGINEDKIILSVGQLIYRKGYDVLLKACQGIDKSIGVYIVGGEPTANYLKMKQDMQLSNVHFIKFMKKEALSEYYKAADLFILPTREDIWGLVINEAMAYGLPVITTDKCIAGMEMITSQTGEIVIADDVNSLKRAIERVLKYRDAYDLMAILDKSRQYTIEKMAAAHIEVFHQCL